MLIFYLVWFFYLKFYKGVYMIQSNLFEFNKNLKKLSAKNILNPAILYDMPFEKIYESARKEASRKKPIFFIHKYFARRITCNFRLMLLGLLLPSEEKIWDYYYESLKIDEQENLNILDPFMGGGTTLFESLRIGASVCGNDLQPLSKFVSSALIKELDDKKLKKAVETLEKIIGEKIKSYYKTTCPECGKQADVMYNFHVKKFPTTSICKEHEFYSGIVISLKKNIFTIVCPKCKDVHKTTFENGVSTCPKCNYIINDPKEKYVNSGKFTCKECDENITLSDLKDSNIYPFETNLVAQEYYCPHCDSHEYKSISKEDIDIYNKAIVDFEALEKELPIPHQEIPIGYNTKQILNHGYKNFKDLFNKRQLLCLGLLLKEIDNFDDDDTKFWLLLAFSGLLEMNNMFCRYQSNASKISNIFFNHAYVPITMPVENNVWGTKLGTGTFIKTIDKIIRGKKFNKEIYDLKAIPSKSKSGFDVDKIFSSDVVISKIIDDFSKLTNKNSFLTSGDSRDLKNIPDNSIDLVITDPPYGGNIMYSELIDFFHVWNYSSSYGKKLGFTTPLTTKTKEIIVNKTRNLSHQNYEDGLEAVFKECYRVSKENTFLVFSFHDKDLESWCSIISALNNAGYNLVSAYPLHSETRTGAHTSNKNSIAFDIFLICQKQNNFTKEFDFKIDEIIQNSLKVTEEYLERLNSVNAEVTIPDIENIFISQIFINLNRCGKNYSINNQNLREEIKIFSISGDRNSTRLYSSHTTRSRMPSSA